MSQVTVRPTTQPSMTSPTLRSPTSAALSSECRGRTAAITSAAVIGACRHITCTRTAYAESKTVTDRQGQGERPLASPANDQEEQPCGAAERCVDDAAPEGAASLFHVRIAGRDHRTDGPDGVEAGGQPKEQPEHCRGDKDVQSEVHSEPATRHEAAWLLRGSRQLRHSCAWGGLPLRRYTAPVFVVPRATQSFATSWRARKNRSHRFMATAWRSSAR
jgi:hypothetical protein